MVVEKKRINQGGTLWNRMWDQVFDWIEHLDFENAKADVRRKAGKASAKNFEPLIWNFGNYNHDKVRRENNGTHEHLHLELKLRTIIALVLMATFWIIPNVFSVRQLRFSADSDAESNVSTIFHVHRVVRTNSWQKRQEKENDSQRTTFPTSTASKDLVQKGGLRTRRPMPIETLLSKGFPEDTPGKTTRASCD